VTGFTARQQDQDRGGSEEDPYQECHGARYRSEENNDPDSCRDSRWDKAFLTTLQFQEVRCRERQDKSDDRDPDDAGPTVLRQRYSSKTLGPALRDGALRASQGKKERRGDEGRRPGDCSSGLKAQGSIGQWELMLRKGHRIEPAPLYSHIRGNRSSPRKLLVELRQHFADDFGHFVGRKRFAPFGFRHFFGEGFHRVSSPDQHVPQRLATRFGVLHVL